ncbi:MAG: HAD family hydrolase [Kiritimatiellia bacterium]|nr:HAD family hydrolase [Kiritimatiellia bacterium]
MKNHSPNAKRPRERAVLFDFDGTLFDASEAIIRSFNAALARAGRPEWPPERIRPLIGRPLLDMFPLAAPDATPAQIEELIAAYRTAFHPICVPLTRPLPGLYPCIETLRADGLRLAIVTNRAGHGARLILQGFGLMEAFPVVIGLDRVTRGKPHPESVLLALKELDVMAESAVLVGDTREDMRSASAAGVRAIGVLTGSETAEPLLHSGAAAIVPDLSHLAPLLAKMLPA